MRGETFRVGFLVDPAGGITIAAMILYIPSVIGAMGKVKESTIIDTKKQPGQ